ncbi:ribulose 1,5-bisphosphate carboxylase large subunit [Candidatus Desantisbacteria bacterium]|nr:ribulose 1,5-bisphosphate carboxylase large subunit [Candidatus Desantisbacteria bacterium]
MTITNDRGSAPRLLVTYQIEASCETIQEIAEDICIEQTVEVVRQLAQDSWIRENILGSVEEISLIEAAPLSEDNIYEVIISYPDRIIDYQLPQLLSVIYGNISLKSGIKVVAIKLSDDFLSHFSGPGFGVHGIRQLLAVENRPLLATALKPMGKTPEELAGLAYKLALGGIDIIKDDHGLVDHSFCPFKERVGSCISAINKVEEKTGKRVLYFPNITDRYEKMLEHAEWAKRKGVGGFLVSPLIVGLDMMRYLADNLGLPIMAHPALMGTLFSGIQAEIVLGDLMRLSGADMIVYPNYGGRFPFTEEICQKIGHALKKEIGRLKTAFPVPAGGIDIKSIQTLKQFYGNDTVFLIGSSLYVCSSNLTANVKDCIQRILDQE